MKTNRFFCFLASTPTSNIAVPEKEIQKPNRKRSIDKSEANVHLFLLDQLTLKCYFNYNKNMYADIRFWNTLFHLFIYFYFLRRSQNYNFIY